MKHHPLTNFEIQKYYENESRFNGVFSRDNLHKKLKDRVYKHKDIGTHWIALFFKKTVLTVLELNIFLKKLKNSLVIET